MKNTLLLLFLLLLLNRSLSAQNLVTVPQKKDNVILIQTPDSASTALRKLAQAFIAQGYVVDRLDKEFLTLSLAPKVLDVKLNPMLSARASATSGANSMLRITGDFSGAAAGRPFTGTAYYQSSDWQVQSKAFRALEKVALAYPNGRVGYTKQ